MQDNAASYIYGLGGMLLEDVAGTGGSDVSYYCTDCLCSVKALTSSTRRGQRSVLVLLWPQTDVVGCSANYLLLHCEGAAVAVAEYVGVVE